ncbi:MAG: hypothetical protein ACRDF4_07585 [Rhabdochlamydiaceae bacterium]
MEKNIHKHDNHNLCKECGEETYVEKYAWDDEFEGYFLVSNDGTLKMNKMLDNTILEEIFIEYTLQETAAEKNSA